ncbi:MAG: hypothetical protein PHU95_02800 [Candidatus Thermoplasmatota archaeon]|nr:hypothetical protein [Candidatus Thermoplasmatota archaeon]MDD5778361.1 hypothetical protein [Candidatus Thermoplasmatota archaeon]
MIALFPCKLDPPHLGHVVTLLDIKDDYDTIILDVLDGGPERLITVEEAVSLIHRVLRHFPGKYEYRVHKKSYASTGGFCDLPNFDVVVSGNQALLDNMREQGYKTRYVERVPVYRGEFMREAYRHGLEYEMQK